MSADMGGYLGILKWSLKYQDGTKPSPQTEMSEETKKWLQECIESVSMDPLDEVKILLKVLEIETADQPTESKEEVLKKKCEALEDIGEYLEDLNLANDFENLNGIKIMNALLDDEHAAIRSRAAGVLAAVVQNFEKTQKAVFDMNVLDHLVQVLRKAVASSQGNSEEGSDSDTSKYGEDPHEKVKMILAVSCLVRGHERATLELLNKYEGFSLLIRVLQSSFMEPEQVASRLQQKVLFFIEFLLGERLPAFVKLASSDSFYETLVQCLAVGVERTDIMVQERSLRVIEKLAGSYMAREHMGEKNQKALLESIASCVLGLKEALNNEDQKEHAEDVVQLAESVAATLGKAPVVDKTTSQVNGSAQVENSPVLLLQ